jgi:hypothetical protein
MDRFNDIIPPLLPINDKSNLKIWSCYGYFASHVSISVYNAYTLSMPDVMFVRLYVQVYIILIVSCICILINVYIN